MPRKLRQLAWALAAAAATLAIARARIDRANRQTVPDSSRARLGMAAEPARAGQRPSRSRTPIAHGPVVHRPDSLNGTVAPPLTVDEAGDLVIDGAILTFFDYFLSAQGEIDDQAIGILMDDTARARLGPDQAATTRALFRAYREYKVSAAARYEALAPGDYRAAHSSLCAAQDEQFGPRAQALFGERNAIAAAALARHEIATDEAEPTRQRELRAAVEAQLPAHLRAARARIAAPARIHQQVATMRAAGADPGEIFDLRAAHFGLDAARRLKALDRERAQR